MFKAIFEDDDDEEEDEEEIPVEIDDTENESLPEEDTINARSSAMEISTIPSSISGINLKEVNKYLELNDDKVEAERSEKILFKKPPHTKPAEPVSIAARFTSLVKNLVDTKTAASSTESSDSSSGSDIYEEVSICKKSSTDNKKKKKKKKHHHKKKSSKKSHKKIDTH